jgi:protein TonB
MSNQLLAPPESNTETTEKPSQPPLWSNIEADGSFWQSLTEGVRERFSPPQIAPLHTESRPIPVRDPFHVDPIWVGIVADFREVFFPPKRPPLQLESKPVAVSDPLAAGRDRRSSWISIGVHAAIFAIIAVLIFWHPRHKVIAAPPAQQVFNITPYMPLSVSPQAAGGGGGGGSRDILQAAKGKLPKIDKTQFVPPDEVIRNPKPKLAVAPTVVMPQNIRLPNNTMPNLGDPLTTVKGPLSNGTGSAGGIGSGKSGGIGSGSGAGVGPGSGGGYGGGVYRVGGGVLAPRLIYGPEAEMTDQARMAKYQGECVIEMVVDAKGLPHDFKIVRHLGMGLDEKALEAVRQYRFKPAMLNGKPVPVLIDVVVDFHIY